MKTSAVTRFLRLCALLLFALFTITACGSETTGALEEETQAPTIRVPDSQEVGVASPTCVPKNCASPHANVCGPISNGCGGTMVCGACINGTECMNGECVIPPWYFLCQECVRTGGHCVTNGNVHSCQH